MAVLFHVIPFLIFAPNLRVDNVARIRALLTPPFAAKNLESLEMEYQQIVQKQTFADLKLIYAPENVSRVQVTYAAFIPSDGPPGRDLGFGLHVVKKLTVPYPGGKSKTIYVNEQWPEDRRTGGLFLPDEIRIQTQVFDGERRVPGSEGLYLFDSIRLAWGEAGEVAIARQTRFTYNRERRANELKSMRVPVSAPLSCVMCHRVAARFTGDFLAEGEVVNHEAIVQDRYFDRPLTTTRGFRDYLAYLRARDASADFLERTSRALLNPEKSFAIPGLTRKLKESIGSFNWLGEDEDVPYGEPSVLWRDRQGVYQRSGVWLVDAIEGVFEGKYRYWEPSIVVPASVR